MRTVEGGERRGNGGKGRSDGRRIKSGTLSVINGDSGLNGKNEKWAKVIKETIEKITSEREEKRH